jgi:hypothetical protein
LGRKIKNSILAKQIFRSVEEAAEGRYLGLRNLVQDRDMKVLDIDNI